MNGIYLNGRVFTYGDLCALVDDRDQWQAEAERLRAEEAKSALVTQHLIEEADRVHSSRLQGIMADANAIANAKFGSEIAELKHALTQWKRYHREMRRRFREVRRENAQLRKYAEDDHAAIVMLITENAKEATPEALLALGEAMDSAAESEIERLTHERDELQQARCDLVDTVNSYLAQLEEALRQLTEAQEKFAVADSVAGDLMNEKAVVLKQLAEATAAREKLQVEKDAGFCFTIKTESEQIKEITAERDALKAEMAKEREARDHTTNDELARIAAETTAPAWWECSHGHRTENAKPFCETCGEHWKHIHDEGQWEQEQMQPWRRQ